MYYLHQQYADFYDFMEAVRVEMRKLEDADPFDKHWLIIEAKDGITERKSILSQPTAELSKQEELLRECRQFEQELETWAEPLNITPKQEAKIVAALVKEEQMQVDDGSWNFSQARAGEALQEEFSGIIRDVASEGSQALKDQFRNQAKAGQELIEKLDHVPEYLQTKAQQIASRLAHT